MKPQTRSNEAGWVLLEAVLLGMIVLGSAAAIGIFARTALLEEHAAARMEAALLAPTAFGKQAFTLAGSGNEVTIRCQESAYAGQDRGLVKYHFEAGAGRDNFVWAP